MDQFRPIYPCVPRGIRLPAARRGCAVATATALLVLFGWSASTGLAESQWETWTSSDGISLRAELLGTDGHSALLRIEETGQVRRAPLERLTSESRQRVAASNAPNLPRINFGEAPSDSAIGHLLRTGTEGEWGLLAEHLRAGLLAAYRGEFSPSIERWHLLYRWIDLFQETPFHSELATGTRPFGHDWPPALRMSVCRDAAFSREFFDLISQHDRLDEVSRILAQLHRASADAFEEYRSLALAIAVVHDQPPPGSWPLSVPDGMLPSRLMPPEETFAFFVSSHRAGRLLLDPRNLPARKLRFAVDLIAPKDELQWAQQSIRPGVAQFGRTYFMVRYDHTRFGPHLPNFVEGWQEDDYRLQTIRRSGGICGDQTYFATQVGKALGLPTIYFSGYGDNGVHAWMGYFEGPTRGWNLEVGRYERHNYRTGNATDPQTWRPIDDHEIHFQQEYFHRTAEYRRSRYHSALAREYKLAGRQREALQAAQRAVRAERRNREAWDLTAEINRNNGRTAAYENTLFQAARAFTYHPHVNADYRGRLANSLLERDAFGEALDLLRDISQENRRNRPDLSMKYSRSFLEHARDNGKTDELVNAYRQVLSQLRGHVSGSNFLYEIASPFLNHLHERGHTSDARILYSQTRRQLNVPQNTQAGHRLQELNQTLR